MKLTKLLLVLTAFTSLVIFSDTASQAASKAGNFTVTANVSNNCTIDTSAANIVFGEYDPITGAAVAGSGTLSIACTKGAPNLHIDLNGGQNYLDPDNRMANGAERLKYGLYVDSGFATRWNHTSWAMPAPGDKAAHPFTIYGQIVANQDVAVGSYSDTVTATINY